MKLPDKDSPAESFFPLVYTTKTDESIDVQIPKFTLRKDHELRTKLRSILKKTDYDEGLGIQSILDLALSHWVDDLIELSVIVFEKDESWIEDNLSYADMMDVLFSLLFESAAEEEDLPESEQGWTLARLIEWFANSYGWKPDEVLDCTRWEIARILEAAADRVDREQEQIDEASSGKKPVKEGMASVKAFLARHPESERRG